MAASANVHIYLNAFAIKCRLQYLGKLEYVIYLVYTSVIEPLIKATRGKMTINLKRL